MEEPMQKPPLLYQKLLELIRERYQTNLKRTDVEKDIASKYRITKNDVSEALRELEEQSVIKKINRDRFKIDL